MPPKARSTSKRRVKTKFCVNCGTGVTGAVALRAADTSTAFCCRCGVAVNDKGKCQNGECVLFGTKPVCD